MWWEFFSLWIIAWEGDEASYRPNEQICSGQPFCCLLRRAHTAFVFFWQNKITAQVSSGTESMAYNHHFSLVSEWRNYEPRKLGNFILRTWGKSSTLRSPATWGTQRSPGARMDGVLPPKINYSMKCKRHLKAVITNLLVKARVV